MVEVVIERLSHKAQDVPGLVEVNIMNNPTTLNELVTATEPPWGRVMLSPLHQHAVSPYAPTSISMCNGREHHPSSP